MYVSAGVGDKRSVSGMGLMTTNLSEIKIKF
jgi:hypothetical protein